MLSDNYSILRDSVFKGKEGTLLERIQEECQRLDKGIHEIILGSRVPSDHEIQTYDPKSTPEIMAIGGGGGFNQVTLKALKC